MRQTVLALAMFFGTALAAGAEGIGVVAPLEGNSAILGRQMRDGAQAAGSALGVTLEIRDDGCTAEGGAAAASDLVAAGVSIVTGFLCTESLEAAMPILSEAGIAVITPGVRTDSLTDRRAKTGWQVYRLGPRADDERNAVAAILERLWRDELFAIIDDGTIYGREMAETFRNTAETSGLKPVFVDTFRPQLENQIGLVGRIRRAGATHVLAGGDREDVAIMGRDAASLDAGIVFAGGEVLRGTPGETPLAAGTIMIGLPEWSDVAPEPVLARLAERSVAPDGYVLPAYAAVEIAASVIAAAAVEARPVRDMLAERDFSTAVGPVRFDAQGNLAGNPYRAFRFDGGGFVPLDEP